MKKVKQGVAFGLIAATLAAVGVFGFQGRRTEVAAEPQTPLPQTTSTDVEALQTTQPELKLAYFAGGCFWGVEAYLSRVAGVYDVASGYANGTTEDPTYEDVIYRETGHAETVRVLYDPNVVTLDELMEKFFRVVDPTSVNKQGNDVGTQYRSGVYYETEEDKAIIDAYLAQLQDDYILPIVVESVPLENFALAEEYHQDYLEKNPNGYCHINLNASTDDEQLVDPVHYPKPTEEVLQETLTAEQYDVTQKNGTEAPFFNEYDKQYAAGIYVDITTGEPLFSSNDKYDSGTGWPSFTSPIAPEVVTQSAELTGGVNAAEVRSRAGDAHLGHVFTDGPQEDGGLRYCMNSAALRFIPYEQMTEEGYGYLKHIVENGQ